GGNTGIAVALMAAARGYECIFTMPNNISPEKIAAMRTMGAEVHAVPVVPFSDRGHYVHLAQRIEAECLRRGGRCVWLNQFDNLANARSHFETTAPEIWRQAGERVDAVVASAGTGGTIAGLSRFFKRVNPNVKVRGTRARAVRARRGHGLPRSGSLL
ncbi:pyridoxal-phosphate dependent enzyme, partial [archaeon]